MVSRRVRIMFEIICGEDHLKGVMWATKRFTSKIKFSSGNTGGGRGHLSSKRRTYEFT